MRQSSSKAQGATEYLVLLAAVLIIALVSIALLSFFPGAASNAEMTQSEAYWRSASPIAIIEWIDTGDIVDACGAHSHPYFRLKNNGPNTITITKMFSGNSSISDVMVNTSPETWAPIRSLYRLGPGEERYIGGSLRLDNGRNWYNLPALRGFGVTTQTAVTGCPVYPWIWGAKSICYGSNRGYTVLDRFGFEYIVEIEGQTATKRQVGTMPVIIKCSFYANDTGGQT